MKKTIYVIIYINSSLCYGDQGRRYMKIKYQWEEIENVYFHIYLSQNDGQSDWSYFSS